MSHMIQHECVGDTPWSRGNVYMRTDIYGTSVLVADGRCSEVKSHLGSHLLTPVTRLYTQHTNRHPEVASSNTMGEGDGCKGKLDL
jgi:hypothetical protein